MHTILYITNFIISKQHLIIYSMDYFIPIIIVLLILSLGMVITFFVILRNNIKPKSPPSGHHQTHSGPTGSDPQGSRYNQEKLCQHRKKHRYNKKRHQHYKCIPNNRLLSFTDLQPKTLLG